MEVEMRILAVIVLLFGIAGAGDLRAQDGGREKDHAALRLLMTNVTEAINSQDVDKLVTYFTPDFVFTAVNQDAITNAAAFKAYYARMFTGDGAVIRKITVAPSADALTRFIGENAGYCTGVSRDEYVVKSNDRTIVMESRWTALLVKDAGQWKVATLHSGVNVLDNPVMEMASMSWFRRMVLALGMGKYPGEK